MQIADQSASTLEQESATAQPHRVNGPARRKTHVSLDQLYSSSHAPKPANLRDNVVRPTWQDLEAPLKCKRILRLRRALLLGKHGRTLISKVLLHLSLEGLAFKLTRRFSHFTDFCCIVLLSLEPRLTHLICLRSLKLEIFVPCFQLTLEDAGKCQESCYDFLISPH